MVMARDYITIGLGSILSSISTNAQVFFENGMEGDAFINAVSGVVNRGCHNPPCGTGPLDGGAERAANFRKVLSVLLNETK